MPAMPRFKLLIEYAGTRYSGWQIQKNARTVQGEIDRAMREATRRRRVRALWIRADRRRRACARAGRAPRALHRSTRPRSLRRKINDELPADIHIRTIAKAPHKFHARHDAVERSYLYQISTRRTAFGKPFVWWIREPLSVDAMREAAAAFVGMQNFEAFTADDPDEKSTRVLVDAVEIEEHGALILIRVRGSHFLWKMVRRMVGVLAAVGRGRSRRETRRRSWTRAHTEVARASAAALAAPAAGLFLEASATKGTRRSADPAGDQYRLTRVLRDRQIEAVWTEAGQRTMRRFVGGAGPAPRHAELDDLEVVGGQRPERGVEHVVVPPRIHRAR